MAVNLLISAAKQHQKNNNTHNKHIERTTTYNIQHVIKRKEAEIMPKKRRWRRVKIA